LCHPAGCVLFHRSACPVENTAVSKLLRPRFMKLHQVLGFHSGIRVNNLHFLLLREVTFLGNWLQTFREKVGSYFQKAETTKTILLFEYTTNIFHRKFRETIIQCRGVITTKFVVLRTRWDEAVARMTGKN